MCHNNQYATENGKRGTCGLACPVETHRNAVWPLRPTVLFARVCGACPSAGADRWLSAVLYFVCTVAVWDLYSWHRGLANDITAVLLGGSCLSLLAHLYAALGSALLTGHRLGRFFAVVESVQRTLFALNINQPAEPTGRWQLVWLAVLAAPSALCALWWLPGLGLVLLVLHARLGLLRASLRLVDDKFSSLNWHLDDLNTRWPLFLLRPPDIMFKELASVDALRRARFVRYGGPHERQLSVAGVAAFDHAHFQLCRALRTLNSAFSCDLLTLTCEAALLVSCGFFRAVGSLDAPSLRPLWLFVTLHHAASFLAVLLYTTSIHNRSCQTALLVHDLLDEEERSADVEDKLAEFSQASLHRRANFTAAGFFNMDLKLISRLGSVLAPVTLFLVQNDNTPHWSATNGSPQSM